MHRIYHMIAIERHDDDDDDDGFYFHSYPTVSSLASAVCASMCL